MLPLLSLLFVETAQAVTLTTDSKIPIAEPKGSGTFSSLESSLLAIANILFNNLTLLAGVIAVFFLVFAGIRYITSGGDPVKAKAARAGLLSAVIGIIIITSTFFIVRFCG